MGTRGVPTASVGKRRFKHLLLTKARAKGVGQPRKQIKVPISPSGELSDTVVYEDPAQPAKKMHLPCLRLRSEGADYDLRITDEAGRWSIRFGIEPFPSEELGDDARTPALPFTIPEAELTYPAPPLDKQLPASEIIPDDGGWTIGFDTDLAGRDEVLWALSSENGIELVVSRAFTAAVPVVTAPPKPIGKIKYLDKRLVLGKLMAHRAEPVKPTVDVRVTDHRRKPVRVRVRDHRDGQPQKEVRVRVRDRLGKAAGEGIGDRAEPRKPVRARIRDRRLGKAAGEGLGDRSERQEVRVRVRDHRRGAVPVRPTRRRRVPAKPAVNAAFRVKPIPTVVAKPAAPRERASAVMRSLKIPILGRRARAAKPLPSKVRLDMLEKFKEITFDPGQVVVARPSKGEKDAELLYRETDSVLPAKIPLRLEPATHPEIFDGGSSDAPSFRTVRVMYPPGDAGHSHVYFQDKNRPETFYYLPDEFCLARTETVPLRPAVVFRVEQGDEEAEARTACTFRLVPLLDHDRLEAATEELRRLIPPPHADETAPEVALVPVQADATLNLGLPVGAELEAPPLDLVNGFVAQVFFPFDEFEDVFAAMASSGELETLLRGNVDVAIGDDQGPASGHALIPVDLSFGSASSDVLTASDSPLAGGGVALSLCNSSESPVRIDALPLRMTRAGTEVPATAKGLELPLELAAGAETSLEVTAAEPLPGEGEVDVLVDLSAVVPLPDPEAILALTLDERISQQSEEEVRVLTTAVKLAGGGDPVSAVVVEFEGGSELVQVDAENMQVTASVAVPLVDVLLRRGSTEFRFRQTVLRASGEDQDEQWRTHDNPVLVVPVV